MTTAFDAEGYLVDLAAWDPDVARDIAHREGIDLTADHWRVIDVLRAFYAETGVSPATRPLVKLVRERVGADLGTSIALMRLFSGSAAKLAAKIAGLPKPINCL